MIKTVVFDMGGVLVWDLWEHLFLDEDGIAESYGLNKDRVRQVAEELWDQFAYRRTQGIPWQRLEQQYWNRVTEELDLSIEPEKLIKLSDQFVRPVAGMNALL